MQFNAKCNAMMGNREAMNRHILRTIIRHEIRMLTICTTFDRQHD